MDGWMDGWMMDGLLYIYFKQMASTITEDWLNPKSYTTSTTVNPEYYISLNLLLRHFHTHVIFVCWKFEATSRTLPA